MVTLSTPVDLHCPAPFERVSAQASVSYRQTWRPKLIPPPLSSQPQPNPADWNGLTAALDALPLPAGLVDERGGVVYANAALRMLAGVVQDDAGLQLEVGATPATAGKLRTRWTRLLPATGPSLDCLTLVLRVDEASGLTAYMFVETRSTGAVRPAPAAESAPPAGARPARLTSREQEVLDRLLTGMSNKGVGRDLGISPRTVEVHRGRVLRKLGIQSLAQAGALQRKL